MEREDEMDNEKYPFRGNSSQSADKLTTLREQSQASHINRIRFAIEKRRRLELERLYLRKSGNSKNMPSDKTTKKGKSTRLFSNKMKLNGPQLIDDNETKRLLTLLVNNSHSRSLEHTGDNEHEADDTQGGIHLVSTSQDSKSLKSNRNGGKKKRRKRWSKATETNLVIPMAENENTTERNGGDGCSEKSLSMKNIEEFNRIQNERDAESLEYVEEKMIARRPATKKDGNVVQWIDSLPSPDSMEPILDTAQDRKSYLHSSSKEDRLTTQNDSDNNSQTGAEGHKGVKCSKKLKRKNAKQKRNEYDLSKIMPDKGKDQKDGKDSISKKGETSTRIGLKSKKDGPIQLAYTPNGNLKIIIHFKKLKPKDTALLVRFGDFQHSTENKENATSSRKLKKGFTYLNDQQMEFFENIFLK